MEVNRFADQQGSRELMPRALPLMIWTGSATALFRARGPHHLRPGLIRNEMISFFPPCLAADQDQDAGGDGQDPHDH